MKQLSIFDILSPEYKITKPIRLIELFAGYGSQNLALKYLNANYEHYKISEWAVKSIKAYNDLHIKDYKDYSKNYDFDFLVDFLFKKGISWDYSNPMTYKQIKSRGESWVRDVYNNIVATNNLCSVTNICGSDLGIVERDKYEYLLTYTFPLVS